MDGVLAHTNPYHKRAYRAFLSRHGRSLSDEEFERRVSGRTNEDVLRDFFPSSTRAARKRMEAEKEADFRRLARGLKPLPGLLRFLARLRSAGAPVALATSAPPENVRFVLAKTRCRDFFDAVLDSRDVKRGKPHPEIYLKAARRLGVSARRCVVFEDSLAGVESARRAGMAVIGVATTHSARELAGTVRVVRDFRKLDPAPATPRGIMSGAHVPSRQLLL
jgi:beta-phosphoglucomutase